MVKIKEYKIQQQGDRGRVITIPKVWIDDHDLQFGDSIQFYRDEEDRLILVPKKRNAGSIPVTDIRGEL